MGWVIAGIVAGLALGAFVTYLLLVSYMTKGIGQAFGYPSPPWWKFWK